MPDAPTTQPSTRPGTRPAVSYPPPVEPPAEPGLSDAWPERPFEPHEGPLSIRQAGHLLRRAAFGAKPDELDASAGRHAAEVLDYLFDFDPTADPFADLLERAAEVFRLDNHARVQEWWIYRIMKTDTPLQERMALFWHDHFATGGSKVNHPRMADQIQLFRRMGLGSFRDLLLATGRGAAMLLWLDGNNAKKGSPNENYAREIMELFTLGHDGGYTEADVRELSRAFTGWRVAGNEGRFDKRNFDDGEKTVLGQRRNFNDEAAVDFLLQQPAAPRFLARKLLTAFVHPEPPAEAVEHYAGRLLHHGWVVGPVLREMLGSRMGMGGWAWRSIIKDPATFCCGVGRMLGGTVKGEFIRVHMNKMGMSLLFPPNVSGWTGGEAWLNAATVLTRYRFAMEAARQTGRWYVSGERVQRRIRESGAGTRPPAIVDAYAELLLDGHLPDEARGKLIDYMRLGDDNKPTPHWKLDGPRTQKKVRGMIHLMMCTPQFQLA